MSQMRSMRSGMRAIVVAAGVCALVIALLVSGLGRSSHMAMGGSHPANCQFTQDMAATAGDPAQQQAPVGHIHCPECCLAAHGVAAVHPDRLAISVRTPRIASTRVSYVVFSSATPQAATIGSVNGARAPPERVSLS